MIARRLLAAALAPGLLLALGCGQRGTFPDSGVSPEDAAVTPEDARPADDAAPVADDARPDDDAAPAAPDADPTADAAPEDAAPGPMDAAPGPGDAGINLDCSRRAGVNPNPNMTFFATSQGTGAAGGNLGGLAGADARCACFAARVGLGGRTWRAYLSVTTPRTNARDRIGAGPWVNFAGQTVAASVAALHANGIDGARVLTEDGQRVPDLEHDILTGSNEDGTPHEPYDCGGWTDGTHDGFAWVGHPDWNLPNGSGRWNSAHECFCDPAGLAATNGSGRLYCFSP